MGQALPPCPSPTQVTPPRRRRPPCSTPTWPLRAWGGDAQFFADLLQRFAPQAQAALDDMAQASVQGLWPAARAAAHKFKSAAATAGAEQLAAASAALERCLTSPDPAPAQVQTLLQALHGACAAALAAQADWLQQHHLHPTAAPAATAPLHLALQALRDALQASALDVFDLHDDLLTQHGHTQPERFSALSQAVNALDTAAALDAIDALLDGHASACATVA